MAKMRELDQPAVQSQAPVQSTPVEECGDMMGGMPPRDEPPHTPPSMSINVNAQGLDDIADLMKLLTKVNPDMMPQGDTPPLPSLGGEPNLLSIKPPMPMELPPLKMLPDLDSEPMDGPGPDMMNPDSDNVSKAQGDIDGDGDHDMDDHDAEKDDDKEEKESFANAGGSDPAYMGVDSVTQSGDDLNKSKQMYKHSYKQGDNPMAMKESDLRAYVKAELTRRLAEAKSK